MRNYEIVFLVHPDQADQTSSIISKLDNLVKDSGGNVHRSENIGNRKLAYPIQDQFKASYGLLNVECNQETILATLLIVAGILLVYSLENFSPNKQ